MQNKQKSILGLNTVKAFIVVLLSLSIIGIVTLIILGSFTTLNASLSSSNSTQFLANSNSPQTVAAGYSGASISSFLATAPTNRWLDFDGVSNYVTLPNNNAFNFTGDNFTVSAWVNLANIPVGPSRIIAKFNGNDGFALSTNASTYYSFRVGNDTSTVMANTSGTASVGVWQLVTGTYNGTTASLYVNGVLKSNKTILNMMDDPADVMQIGANQANEFLNGSVDDVRIYTTALTNDTIRSMYLSGRLQNVSAYTIGLIAYYPLNEGTGTTIYDLSGNGYNGALN